MKLVQVHFATFCTGHSSSTVGPTSLLSMAPATSSSVRRRPRKTDVANTIGDVRGFVELDSCSSTIGGQLVMKVPNCFVFVARTPDNDSKSSQRLGTVTPAVMRIFMQKPSTLLTLPVIDFHQRLQMAQSGFKGMDALHFGDPTKSTGCAVRKYAHRRSAFA